MKSIIIILLFILHSTISAQTKCATIVAKNNYSKNNKFGINLTKNIKFYEVTFENPTNDTLYIFSSYFKDEYTKSKYLNRINKKEKIIKMSFLPLAPYLSYRLNHVILTGEKKLIRSGQIKYDFIMLPPKTSYTLNITNNNLQKDYSMDFEIKNMKLSNGIRWKKSKFCKSKNYSKVIEFAVYRNIYDICSFNYYVSDTLNYINKIKDFDIYTVEINDR